MPGVQDQSEYHFKAATGLGAVVDGSVQGTSADQVANALMKQGLIPLRVWREEVAGTHNLLARAWQSLRHFATRRRTSHSNLL